MTVGPYLQKAQFLLIVGSYFQKVQFFLIAGSNHPKAQFLLIAGSYFRGAFNKPTKEIDISSEGPTVMQKESCTPIVGPEYSRGSDEFDIGTESTLLPLQLLDRQDE